MKLNGINILVTKKRCFFASSKTLRKFPFSCCCGQVGAISPFVDSSFCFHPPKEEKLSKPQRKIRQERKGRIRFQEGKAILLI
jgi:hypothetical protein